MLGTLASACLFGVFFLSAALTMTILLFLTSLVYLLSVYISAIFFLSSHSIAIAKRFFFFLEHRCSRTINGNEHNGNQSVMVQYFI